MNCETGSTEKNFVLNKNWSISIFRGVLITVICISCIETNEKDYTQFVNRFIGTGGNGGIVPVAAMPFGMVQLGPDTRTCDSGYHYDDENIYVNSVFLNGMKLNRGYLTFKEVLDGGELQFEMINKLN